MGTELWHLFLEYIMTLIGPVFEHIFSLYELFLIDYISCHQSLQMQMYFSVSKKKTTGKTLG